MIGLEYRAADLPALLARLAAAGSQVVTEVQEVRCRCGVRVVRGGG